MNNNLSTVTIKNFNLNLFGNLLNQSLSVTPQLMLEFNNGLLKSCSFSQTKSLIKLWTIPYQKLIYIKPNENDIENILDENQLSLLEEELSTLMEELPTFNFYILNGVNFKNYLSVFGGDSVNLTFNLINNNGKKQATSLIIEGFSTSNSPLSTEFTLTTEELISNVISDYSEILRECTPDKSFKEFHISSKQIIEIRGLIKKLHKSNVDNTAYLTFNVNNNTINIKDKVFNLSFKNENNNPNNGEYSFSFNILKSDFTLIGDHNFEIYTNNETLKVIFGAKYGNSIIWCMSTKVGDYTQNDSFSTDEEDDDILNSLNMSEYIDD